MQESRELVPPEPVAPQQEEPGGLVDPEEVPSRGQDPGQPVWGARHEEAQGVSPAAVLVVDAELGLSLDHRVHEGPEEEPPLPVDEMQACRGREGQGPVLLGGVVGGQETRRQDRPVEGREEARREPESA